jgi:hypothetical protein
MDTTATAPRKTSPLAIIAALVVGLLIGGGAMWLLRASPADIAADQFCALSEGTTLLEVGAWTKAAQSVSDDWPAVLATINDQCPAWRDQVVAKSEALAP